MGIWDLEKEGRGMTLRCSKSSSPEWRYSPFFGEGKSLSRTKVWAGIGRSTCSGAMCRTQVGPVSQAWEKDGEVFFSHSRIFS